MNDLDYYTVMESRINYFAKKYDPLNKLSKQVNRVPLAVKNHKEVKSPKNPARKIIEKFDSVIAVFL